MLVLDGYFDESGTHNGSDAVAVAGYLSPAEQWECFVRDWVTALAEWDLSSFHMADFANKCGLYASWSDQDRRARFSRLVSIINRHAIASIGFVVPKKSFDAIFPIQTKKFVGGAYGLASVCCFEESAKALRPNFDCARIAYRFETGAQGRGEVRKVFDWNVNDPEQKAKYKLQSLDFGGKKDYVPLQAADILAYELYKYAPHAIEGGDPAHGARLENLQMLAACKVKAWGRLEDAELFKWAQVTTTAEAYHRAVSRQKCKRKAVRQKGR